MNQLEQARIEINKIDEQMAVLFERRMQAAEQVAAYKKENGLPILDTGREREVLNRVSGAGGDRKKPVAHPKPGILPLLPGVFTAFDGSFQGISGDAFECIRRLFDGCGDRYRIQQHPDEPL